MGDGRGAPDLIVDKDSLRSTWCSGYIKDCTMGKIKN